MVKSGWRERLAAVVADPRDPRARRRLLSAVPDVAVAATEALPPTLDEAELLCRTLHALGRNDPALAWCRHALTLEQSAGSDLRLLMGECLVALGDFEEAHRWFLQASLHAPEDDPQGLKALAVGRAAFCLADVGAPREAAALCDEALRRLGDSALPERAMLRARLHVRAALCHAELGDAEAALMHYLAAAEGADEVEGADPREASFALDSLLGAGELALQRGDRPGAERTFQRAERLMRKLPPRTAGPTRRIRLETGVGLTASESGRYAEATRHLRAALRRLEGHGAPPEAQAILHQHLAVAAGAQDRPAQAHTHFRTALALRAPVTETRPEMLAEQALCHQLYGTFLLEIGDGAGAEQAFSAAVNLLEALPADVHIDARLISLVEHQLGACLARRGGLVDAETHFRAAVSAARLGDSQGRVDPDSLAASLSQLGTLLLGGDRPTEALEVFQEVESLWAAGAPHPLNPEAIGAALHAQAACFLLMGGPENEDRAIELLTRAVAMRLLGDADGRVDGLAAGTTCLVLAQTLQGRERLNPALRSYEQAAHLLEDARADPAVSEGLLGLVWHSVAACRAAAGDLRGAIEAYDKAAVEKGHRKGARARDVEHLSVTLHEQAGCRLALGDVDAAARGYLEAARVAARGDAEGVVDHESVGTSLHQAGHCHAQAGRLEKARDIFDQAVGEKLRGDREGVVSPTSVGTTYQAIGYCVLDEGRRTESQLWFRRALNEKRRGDAEGRVDHASVGSALHQLAYTLAADGRMAEAVESFQRAAEAKAQGDHYGRVDHESLGATLHLVGDCLLELGSPDDALQWYVRSVEAGLKGDTHGRVDRESVGLSMHQAGFACFQCERLEDAEAWFLKAGESKRVGGPSGRVDHESLGTTLHELAFCAVRREDWELARERFVEAAEAKLLGDTRGRVEPANVSRCLLRAAECETMQGRHWDARITLERAARVVRPPHANAPVSPAAAEVQEELDEARRRNRAALTRPG